MLKRQRTWGKKCKSNNPTFSELHHESQIFWHHSRKQNLGQYTLLSQNGDAEIGTAKTPSLWVTFFDAMTQGSAWIWDLERPSDCAHHLCAQPQQPPFFAFLPAFAAVFFLSAGLLMPSVMHSFLALFVCLGAPAVPIWYNQLISGFVRPRPLRNFAFQVCGF